ncbi:Peptidase aspartic [Penicillium coprophilum]|uniref:Peptidase aspartic n=1 Tax=Penicillium coprophilum TaxID=36646 RepID=UPI0023863F1D|nr:Peptidase aspartic [Penicillium coprophilum]KAJ5154324.1 Peptidase aspartic [Penicillium coprophilum]
MFSILLLFAILGLTSAQRPWVMKWSPKSYGPDGPWNAVLVKMGSGRQEIAMYAGRWWETWVFLSDYCSNITTSPVCYAEEAGLFNPGMSSTWDNTSIKLDPTGYSWEDLNFSPTNAVPVSGKARRARETMELYGTTVPDVDLISISQGYQTYPGGQSYPLQVGYLSLGAQDVNQTFDKLGATMITSWLWNGSGTISSYTYGMHIGSAPLGIAGSLMLGGYDKSRALGEVSAQPHTGSSAPISLLDISLGVAEGGSPWKYPSKAGLLAQGNSSLESGVSVHANVVDPYIYLPQSSCDAIAAELPVTHNADLGLYFWNTDDPQYSKIVNSPSYLAFTFVKDNTNTQNITIKVPFALLNLTLEAPLVTKPTPYFPCFGTEGTYALGRAFFQSAFIGVNYGAGIVGIGNWFLAQAPGPGYSQTNTIAIEESAAELSGSGDSWEETWASHWSPLTETNSTSAGNSSTKTTDDSAQSTSSASGDLSTGATAGIGAGCGAAGLVVIALVAWWLIRRRRQKRMAVPKISVGQDQMPPMTYSQYSGQSERVYWGKQTLLSELDNSRPNLGPYEMGSGR